MFKSCIEVVDSKGGAMLLGGRKDLYYIRINTPIPGLSSLSSSHVGSLRNYVNKKYKSVLNMYFSYIRTTVKICIISFYLKF